MSDLASKEPARKDRRERLGRFHSPVVDRARQSGNILELPGGQIRVPKVFGFCRGVERALEMLDDAVRTYRKAGPKLFLLGEIIHNPWVNKYFQKCGVEILSSDQRDHPEKFIGPEDCAVIPAFGVPLDLRDRLEAIGCEIVDTSCGDVRRLWKWVEHAAADGYGVLIFGRALHDETVVTKSRLASAGGKYLVTGNLEEVGIFCKLISGEIAPERFASQFGPEATNTETLKPLMRLAQASQTTMLYNETLKVRQMLTEAFEHRFPEREARDRLRFEPTVCQATQARQSAAVELCQHGCDLAIVVGGAGSSNTRALYELACSYARGYFIETAEAIHSRSELETYDFDMGRSRIVHDWLPLKRPLQISVLAGASSPEIVVGEVLEKLAQFLQ